MTNTLSAVAMEPASIDGSGRNLADGDGNCLLGERVYGLPCRRAREYGCNGCHMQKKANAVLSIAEYIASCRQ